MKYLTIFHTIVSVALLMASQIRSIIAFGFLGSHMKSNLIQKHRYHSSILSHPYHTIKASSTSLQYSSDDKLSDVFVLSFDGVIADTLEWRSNLAIDVALEVWSDDLKGLKETYNLEKDRLWLVNKISALLPDILTGHDGAMGTDAAFLARLLLEEQLLDDGRSNGCNGKYGSKFHPSSTTETLDTSNQSSSNKQGSRPLTVGEISANWNQGGCIKDTIRVKYHLNWKDPVLCIEQTIQSKISQSQQQQQHLQIHEVIVDAMKDSPASIFILVGHESHVSFVKSVLQQSGVHLHGVVTPSQVASFATASGIYLLTPDADCKTHSQVIQTMLSDMESSIVHVLHSDIFTLNTLKPLLNHVPRRGRFGDCTVGIDNQLKLTLPSWGTSLQAQNDAEMDAWLETCESPLELVDILSSRIISE